MKKPKAQPAEEQRASRMIAEWVRAKRPVLQFVLVFGVLMAIFYGVFYTQPREGNLSDRISSWYLARYASASASILSMLGYDTKTSGAEVRSPAFAVNIVRGCDAMEATAMFVCGVLAFPAPWSRRLIGLLLGVPLLVMINLTRIVSLFMIGVHRRSIFETMHIDVWQPLFILLTVVVWLAWLAWAVRRPRPVAEDAD